MQFGTKELFFQVVMQLKMPKATQAERNPEFFIMLAASVQITTVTVLLDV
jgi:hypothetical protein